MLCAECSFDRLQNLNQAESTTIPIAKGSQQNVHVIRHNDRRVNMDLGSVVVKTVLQHNVANGLGQRFATTGTERYE